VLRLEQSLNAWSRPRGPGLATQVSAGRHLRLLDPPPPGSTRLRVRLLEDGYPCWLESDELTAHSCPAAAPPLPRLDRAAIRGRLPQVLAFTERAAARSNVYLWGGSLGPDFDCSGLVQTAFASAGPSALRTCRRLMPSAFAAASCPPTMTM
jgi:hypothetical protein